MNLPAGIFGKRFRGFAGNHNMLRQRTDYGQGIVRADRISAKINGQLYNYDGDIRNYLFDSSGQISSDNKEVGGDRFGALNGKVRSEFSTA